MIGKLTGAFGGSTPEGSIIVDVSGVGYVVRLPTQAHTLTLLEGERLSLYIHTAVRDDAIDLYGFVSEEELGFFKQLMQVSGIGPKTALGIMGVADVSSLKRSIAQGDSVTMIKVYGISKKSAERLVVELRDKIKITLSPSDSSVPTEDDGEVLEALIALGYRPDESRTILKKIPSNITGTNNRIAAALRQLGK